MSDEKKGGILQLAEIIDVPLRLKIGDNIREVKLLDNEGLLVLVSEVKQNLARPEAEKAKTIEEIEAVKRKYQNFDMTVDQIARYCFQLDGSEHVLSLAMRRSGMQDKEIKDSCTMLRRQLGAQRFAGLAAEVSGIFPAQLKETPVSEGGGQQSTDPTDTSTTGPKISP